MIEKKPGRTKADLLITGAAEILTCVPTAYDQVGRRSDITIAVKGEHILAVGSYKELAAKFDLSSARLFEADGKIIAPGFVDSHTHLVFGGSRAREYGLSMTHSREEIEALGVEAGILATVDMTRAASTGELIHSGEQRLLEMFRQGTTTVESKSGYGLNLTEEIKILEVNQHLQGRQPVDVISTFLGAHEFPKEIPRQEYLDLIVQEMIPQVAERRLAVFCDVYCDEGYYTVAESKQILEAGLTAGLAAKIHTDAYSSIGGTILAAELGAVSADHLNYTDRKSMHLLAEAGVTAVVMPALDFAVQHPRPFDALALMQEGVTVALATDFCPACWVDSMQLVLALACRLYSFSPEEALYAATAGGARALGLDDRGSIEAGKLADLQIWNVPEFEDVIYRIGANAVESVIKRGRVYDFKSDQLVSSDR